MSARCEPPIAPDYLDALVAEVAALRAERSRAMKVEVSGELLGTAMRAWVDSCGDLRATLAAVIPAIQAEALERAAVEVDCCCAHKADVLAVRGENSGDRWRACGQTECMALLARAIRALKEGT